MKEFFGIDFGTTNSAVVGRLLGSVTEYGDSDDQPFPSLVAVNRATGEVQAVGKEAWNHRQELAESCRIFSSVKSELGSGHREMVGPVSWTPEKVVTEVLKGLKGRVAVRGHGSSLGDAVIAIPVGFSPDKRLALRRAAEAAGITISGFVSEPTAAVFRSFESVQHWPRVAVFDWGGGTLDIAVLSIQDNVVTEIATVSRQLGGDGLDRLLAEWAHAQIVPRSGGSSFPFSGMESKHRDALTAQCETAKRMLAEADESNISLPRYGEYGTVNVAITMDLFGRLMAPKIEEALGAVEEAVVHRARLSFEQVHLLLVGGSSKLRGLQDAMARRGWQFSLPERSEWHVADGSAILASCVGEYIPCQNIGIRLCDNTIYPIVNAGEPLDRAEQSSTFGLLEDTDHAQFVFVESCDGGQQGFAATDRILGYLSVPAFGFTNEPIHLESHVDENLLLHVRARSQRRGKSHAREWTYPEVRFSYRLPEMQ